MSRMHFTTKVYLHFPQGKTFSATSNLSEFDHRLIQGIWGEAAFTTGHTGYQETITDPSFLGQHIIFSTPHIGNYPPQEAAFQSQKSHGTSIIAPYFSPNLFLEE